MKFRRGTMTRKKENVKWQRTDAEPLNRSLRRRSVEVFVIRDRNGSRLDTLVQCVS